MNSPTLTMLGFFLQRQQDLRRRLKRRLGSDDLVDEVLQETYLRVERMDEAGGQARNPGSYLFRMALNVAADQRQGDGRFLTGDEVEELLHLADDALDPARVVHARLEVEVLEQALSELTARQRAILLAARVEEVPHADIAARYGISVRMVGKELRKALEFCGARLDRKVIQRFGPGAGNES